MYDDASITRGRHTLKFGVGVERDQLNQITNTGDFFGRYFFSSVSISCSVRSSSLKPTTFFSGGYARP